MTISLAKFLVDFSDTATPQACVLEAGSAAVDDTDDTVARLIDDARRQAAEEARAEGAEALASLRAEHATAREDDRQRWVAEEGERISAALKDGLARLEERLADTVAELLQPLVTEVVRRKAADDLRDAVASVLANSGDVSVTVTGPDDLTETIRSNFAGPTRLTVAPGTSGDVVIQAGDTQIRTQLETWAERLRLNLGAQL